MNNDPVVAVTSNAKARKMPLYLRILLIALPVLLVGVAAVSFFLLLRESENPFQKTTLALFPELSVVEDLKDGGSLTLSGEISSDLYESLKKDPVTFALQYQFKQNDHALQASAGSGGHEVQVGLVHKADTLYLQSNILDQTFSVNAESWKKDLKESIFAPDSGNEYAISPELYDLLTNAWEEYQKTKDASTAVTEGLTHIWKTVSKDLTRTESKEAVSLLDGEVSASVISVLFEEENLIDVANAVWSEYETNEAFRSLIIDQLGLTDLPDTSDSEIDQFVKDMVKDFKTSVIELDFKATLRLAIYEGYWVAATLEWQSDGESLFGDPQKETGNVKLIFSQNPAKDPRCKASVSVFTNDKETFRVEASYQNSRDNGKKTSRLEIEFTASEEDATFATRICAESVVDEAQALFVSVNTETAEDGKNFKQNMRLELSGTYVQDQKRIAISIRDLSLYSGSSLLLHLDRSKVEIEISTDHPDMKEYPEAQPLFVMNAEEFAKVKRTANENLTVLAAKINEAIGEDVLRYEYQLQDHENLYFDQSHYAYDRETHRLFVAISSEGKENFIEVYNVDTMQKIGTIEPTIKFERLFADGGYLAVCSSYKNGIEVYDTSSLKYVQTINNRAYICDGVIDGIDLICTNNESLYHINLKTGEVATVASNLPYAPDFYLDRSQRIVCVKATDPWSNSQFNVNYQIDSRSNVAYKKSEPTIQNRAHNGYTLISVLYADEFCSVAYEYKSNSREKKYFIYTANGGSPVGEIFVDEFYQMIPVANGTYLVCDSFYKNATLSFTKYTLREEWTVHFPQ